MSLIARYHERIRQAEIIEDAQQLDILQRLQRISDALRAREQQNFWKRWHDKLFPPAPIKGLYFWGGVGLGKTYLMDMFYQHLAVRGKIRLHFHRFMKQVHAQLAELQGMDDPLQVVADNFAKRAVVLCFDEFFVNDIGDAMILGRLFTALFERGICLVTTSNIAPDNLYMDGLHRARFLPTIDLLLDHCDVYAMESLRDYRLRTLEQVGVYFHPLNAAAERQMTESFSLYSHGSGEANVDIEILSRMIATHRLGQDVVWFDFDTICNRPRSQMDFLAIAERFSTVFVSGVPVIGEYEESKITYLILLVDVFYDEEVQLILSAEAPPPLLYTQGSKSFEFKRTISRLTEMQSLDYWQRAEARCEQRKQHSSSSGAWED